MNDIELLKAIKQTGATAEEVIKALKPLGRSSEDVAKLLGENCKFCIYEKTEYCSDYTCEDGVTEFIKQVWEEV